MAEYTIETAKDRLAKVLYGYELQIEEAQRLANGSSIHDCNNCCANLKAYKYDLNTREHSVLDWLVLAESAVATRCHLACLVAGMSPTEARRQGQLRQSWKPISQEDWEVLKGANQ